MSLHRPYAHHGPCAHHTAASPRFVAPFIACALALALAFTLAPILATPSLARATTFAPLTLRTLTAQAHRVVAGTVTSVTPLAPDARDPARRRPLTRITLTVEENLFGDDTHDTHDAPAPQAENTRTLDFDVPGGPSSRPGETVIVSSSGLSHYTPGARVLVFLVRTHNRWHILNLNRGAFTLSAPATTTAAGTTTSGATTSGATTQQPLTATRAPLASLRATPLFRRDESRTTLTPVTPAPVTSALTIDDRLEAFDDIAASELIDLILAARAAGGVK